VELGELLEGLRRPTEDLDEVRRDGGGVTGLVDGV
jgi:hypothetical protein